MLDRRRRGFISADFAKAVATSRRGRLWIFYLVNAIEKYGSGFIRIRKALQEYPEIDFEIKEFAGGVMATFSRSEGASGGASGAEQVAGEVTEEVTESSVVTSMPTRFAPLKKTDRS